MTLTLDEVRKTRFHMARRAGYEVTDVDTFVDKVEATLNQMTDEANTLKQQVASLSNGQSDDAPNDLVQENDRLRQELEAARSGSNGDATATATATGEIERLRRENEQLRQENAQLKQRPAPAATPAAASSGSTTAERIVVTTSEQASPAVVRLVQLATMQAEQVVREADEEATRKVDEANRRSHEITVDARTRAERVESEARVNAEKLTSDAQGRADKLDSEVADRRSELFTQLETERDDLSGRVADLRSFESSFRDNLTGYLKSQIASLEQGKFEPDQVPSLLGEASAKPEEQSATPRLDALLGDGNDR